MRKSIPPSLSVIAAFVLSGGAGLASAAEGFEPRYNLAGSLGGEMFAPPNQAGWLVVMAVTSIRVSRVTGNDGKAMTQPIPGDIVGCRRRCRPASIRPTVPAWRPSAGPGR